MIDGGEGGSWKVHVNISGKEGATEVLRAPGRNSGRCDPVVNCSSKTSLAACVTRLIIDKDTPKLLVPNMKSLEKKRLNAGYPCDVIYVV